MAKLIQGNGRNERVKGVALEFAGVTVTTTDTEWKERAGGATLNYTNALTNVADAINVTAAGGALTYTGIPPVPKANQKILFWLSAYFDTNLRGVDLGDSTNGVGIDLQNNLGYLTIDASNYIEFAAGADISALDRSLFFMVDLADGSSTKYKYTDAGVLDESAAGTLTGTVDSFDLTADATFAIATATTMKNKSFGMIYFDETPTDLTTGLEWMAANPTLGAYSLWREISG